MKTLLDLIQEFAVLNNAKTLGGGVLPPKSERRWQELKQFYDLLMAQEGYCAQPAGRFSLNEIREQLSARMRLRVRTEMEIIVQCGTEYVSARVGNLSCGGVLLLCDTPFETGSRIKIHLTQIARREGTLLTEGVVVWTANVTTVSGPRYRVGVRFVGLDKDNWSRLDSFVVESIESRLLSLPAAILDPEFVRREQLVLNA